jgi:hypothetical protein
MPTQSENYGLWVGMVTDDFLEPQHVDRAARVLDRVLGGVVGRLLAAGVYEGWLIGNDKTVGAGWGVLVGAMGLTEAAQAIDALTNGAVNYVFAVASEDTAPEGVVKFAAQTGPVGPAGALYLGTVELDGDGNVLAVANDAAGVDRGAFPAAARTLSGSGEVLGVGGGETVPVEISHAALAVPGAIGFTVNEGFSFVIEEAWRGDGFRAEVTNEGTEAADLEYVWERKGIG